MTDPGQLRESLSPLKLAFLKLQEAEARIRQLEAAADAPIAVVGIGCRIPGAEHGPDAYWRLIRDQVCAVSSRLEQRLRSFAVPVELPESARCAALLEQVDLFDPHHFGISPREAAAMDPQQRLLLEVSWEALEHAGINPHSLYQTRTGVYVGINSHDYAQLQMRDGNLKAIHPHFASGAALSIAAGRIAYTLGLNGPAISVDTACSSSLVAVHLACEALRRQECSTALAGGVNLILAPEASIAFAQAGMLSPRGTCSVFDNSADGFVRGEGCGIVVLKRLADAKADGDRVLAVITGSAVNQDGASSGLTAPNGLAQQAILLDAHRRAGIEPWQVGYVEAHGTGTKLGDPVEAEALGAVFSGRSRKLAIGSVKANIGHLESAAGIAGLIKLVMSLERRKIPGQIHWTYPNEHIRWQELPLEVLTETQDWQPIAGRRIGGVSAFGFSGTNAHIVVEEPPRDEQEPNDDERSDTLTISARTEGALRRMVEVYSTFLNDTEGGWSEICNTSALGRAALPQRLAVVANSRKAAAEKLTDWLQGKASKDVYCGHAEAARSETNTQTASLAPEVIAKMFVDGGSLYGLRDRAGNGLRRAQLPIYIFQKEHYWFKEMSSPGRPVADASPTLSVPEEPATQGHELPMLIAKVSAEQRLEAIRNYLRNEVARVLEMDSATELDENRPLAELGMDSLIALELKNYLQQSSGIILPANFMFEYSTIARAAIYLNAMIGTSNRKAHPQDGSSEREDVEL